MPPILINRAPWNALIDDSGQNLDGTPWTKAQIKGVLLDPIDVALADVDDGTTKDAAQDTTIAGHTTQLGLINTGAWTPYAPVWKTSGAVQPAIGNGSLTGRYALMGKTVHVVVRLATGSTTTYGDPGVYNFSLPFAALDLVYAIPVALFTPAGGALPAAIGYAFTGVTDFYAIASTGTAVGPAAPFAWANGAQLIARFTYERA